MDLPFAKWPLFLSIIRSEIKSMSYAISYNYYVLTMECPKICLPSLAPVHKMKDPLRVSLLRISIKSAFMIDRGGII